MVKIEVLQIENLLKNKIVNADCIDFLQSLPSESIDCIITDPPYMGVVNEKWDNQWQTIDDYISWCNEWIEESKRVLKKSGSFYVFGWSYQLGKLIDTFENNGFLFRQDIVIWKGLQSISGRASDKLKMFPTATEHLHFYHVNSKDYIRDLLQERKLDSGLSAKEINEYLGKASNGGGTWSTIAGLKQKNRTEPTKRDWEMLDKLFGNLPKYEDVVYTFNLPMGLTDVFDDINFYGVKKNHPTEKPLKLMERIIECGSNVGDLVLDIFSGSGSTAIASINCDRRYLGCELDMEYYEKSINRIKSHNGLGDFFE